MILGFILGFAGLMRGAHDLWSATLVYLSVSVYLLILIIRRCWTPNNARSGFYVDLFWPLALLLLVFFLSFLQAINPSESRLGFLDWTTAVLVFLITLNTTQETASLRALMGVMAAVVIIQLGAVFVGIGNPKYQHLKDIPGTLNNANIQTSFFLAWFPVFFFSFLQGMTKTRRIWLIPTLACVTGIVVLSSSYGLLCLAAGALLTAAGTYPQMETLLQRHKKLLLGAGLCLAVLLGFLLFRKFSPSAIQMFNGVPIYDPSSRLWWWISAIHMLRDYPWLGVGIGNFSSAYLAYQSSSVQHTLYAHGLPLQLLAETGFLGSFTSILVAGTLALRLNRERRNLKARWGFLIGACTLVLFSLISISLEYLSHLITLAFLLGAVVAPSARSTVYFRRSVIIVAGGFLVAGGVWLFSFFQASRHLVEGQNYLSQGQFEEADKHFKIAIELDPQAWEPYHGSSLVAFNRYVDSRNPDQLTEAARLAVMASARNRLNPQLKQWVLDLSQPNPSLR